MDHEARAAEIAWLRGVVAAGSQDITRIHIPLIGHLIEAGETTEAVACSIVAADHLWAQGLILKAFAVLRRALALDPGSHELRQRDIAWKAAVDPDLRSLLTRSPCGRVTPIAIALEERNRDDLERAMVTWDAGNGTLRARLYHPNRSVPTVWLARAHYAVELRVGERTEHIPCTAAVADVQQTHHVLVLTPATPAAAETLRRELRIHPTNHSNVVALLIDTGVGPPMRLPNIFHTDALALPS